MSFAQRVENVVTYVAVSLIDYIAFHRSVTELLPVGHSDPRRHTLHCSAWAVCIRWHPAADQQFRCMRNPDKTSRQALTWASHIGQIC